jgi:hypothetical protein
MSKIYFSNFPPFFSPLKERRRARALVPRGHPRHPAAGRRLRPNQAGGVPQGLKTNRTKKAIKSTSAKFPERMLFEIKFVKSS